MRLFLCGLGHGETLASRLGEANFVFGWVFEFVQQPFAG
jgi:hypothetical protein